MIAVYIAKENRLPTVTAQYDMIGSTSDVNSRFASHGASLADHNPNRYLASLTPYLTPYRHDTLSTHD
jgi:hypothetical protein